MLKLQCSTGFTGLLRLVFGGQPPLHVARILSQKLIEQLKIESPPVDPSCFLSHFGIRLLEWTIPNEGFLTTAGRLKDHADQYPWVGGVPDDLCDGDPDL